MSDATAAADMCPRCKGDNNEGWALCTVCDAAQQLADALNAIESAQLYMTNSRDDDGEPNGYALYHRGVLAERVTLDDDGRWSVAT